MGQLTWPEILHTYIALWQISHAHLRNSPDESRSVALLPVVPVANSSTFPLGNRKNPFRAFQSTAQSGHSLKNHSNGRFSRWIGKISNSKPGQWWCKKTKVLLAFYCCLLNKMKALLVLLKAWMSWSSLRGSQTWKTFFLISFMRV